MLNKEQFIELLKVLITTVEEAEGYAVGHSVRVMEYSLALASFLEPPYEFEDLPLACLLHDIGMLGVPREILLKPSRVTPEERIWLEKHPVFGVEMLQNVAGLEGILPLIRHHHENWDGSGYPDGLKGEEIPLGARIIRVADAFEALTSKRPHRWALSIAEAAQQIWDRSGQFFDPKVVEAFDKAYKARRLIPK